MINFNFTVPHKKQYAQVMTKNGLANIFSNHETIASKLIDIIGPPLVITSHGAEWIVSENELDNIPTDIFIEGVRTHDNNH